MNGNTPAPDETAKAPETKPPTPRELLEAQLAAFKKARNTPTDSEALLVALTEFVLTVA